MFLHISKHFLGLEEYNIPPKLRLTAPSKLFLTHREEPVQNYLAQHCL